MRLLAIAHAFSWAVALGIYALGGLAAPLRHVAGGFIYMLGPAFGAVVAVRVLPHGERRAACGLSRPRFDRWIFLAWLVPMVLVAAATLGSALVPGVHVVSPAAGLMKTLESAGPDKTAKLASFPPAVLSVLLVLQASVMGATVNVPFMLSEELGWRGLLWSRWQALGFWRNAAATGFVWGLWHAPIIALGHNYPGMPVLGIGLMIVFCTLLTPALHLVRERGGTVWHACLFHGTINAGATMGALCIVTPVTPGSTGGDWAGRGLTGLPGFVVLGASALVVALVRARDARVRGASWRSHSSRGRWRSRGSPQAQCPGPPGGDASTARPAVPLVDNAPDEVLSEVRDVGVLVPHTTRCVFFTLALIAAQWYGWSAAFSSKPTVTTISKFSLLQLTVLRSATRP